MTSGRNDRASRIAAALIKAIGKDTIQDAREGLGTT